MENRKLKTFWKPVSLYSKSIQDTLDRNENQNSGIRFVTIVSWIQIWVTHKAEEYQGWCIDSILNFWVSQEKNFKESDEQGYSWKVKHNNEW